MPVCLPSWYGSKATRGMLISPSVLGSSILVVSNQRPALAITIESMLLGFAWVSHDTQQYRRRALPRSAPEAFGRTEKKDLRT
jgi:hypothetical protein